MEELVAKGQVWMAYPELFQKDNQPVHVVLSDPMFLNFHPFTKRTMPEGWYVEVFDAGHCEVWLATAELQSWKDFGVLL